MEERAQANIEIALIIAGVVVIATAVALIVKNTANTATNAINEQVDTNT